MEIHIISLLKATERRDFQRAQFARIKLPFEFFDAVTINEIDQQEVRIKKDGWERPLMPTEVACFLSHLRLWMRVAKGEDAVLILEDDAIVADSLPDFISHIGSLDNVDHLSLETRGRKKLIGSVQSIGGTLGIAPLYQDRTGAAAYVLWPSGAQALVDQCLKNGAALADAFISSNYRIRSWQAIPALCVQSDMSEYYGLENKLQTHSYIQENDTKSNYKAIGSLRWIFKARRLLGQLSMARRWSQKVFISTRVLVDVHRLPYKSNTSGH